MSKIAAFVDGSAFLDGLRGQGSSIEIDAAALLKSLRPGKSFERLYMYLAPWPEDVYPVRSARQKALADAFMRQGFTIRMTSTHCNKGTFVERGFEALIAADMLESATSGECQTLLLLSRRGELSPLVQMAKRLGRRVELAFIDYPTAEPNPLAMHADATQSLDVSKLQPFIVSGPQFPFAD